MLPPSIDLAAQKTLQQVSFTVERGEWVTLLGANGSGKSTLARLANGLLLPNEGAVIADGVSSWQHERLTELRKLVGLVTQDPDNQIVSTTVFDEVAFGPQNLAWEAERIYAVVSEALQSVGLNEDTFAKRDPNTLSGGEKQRVVIAAILAMQPHYLVLDEPTAMLDPLSRAQVLSAIAAAAEQGHGVLHITHLLKEASFSQRVLVLQRGRLVYDGEPEGILGNEEAFAAYGLMASPAQRGLLEPRKNSTLASRDSAKEKLLQVQTPPATSDETLPDKDDYNASQGAASKSTESEPGKAPAPSSLEFCDVSFSYTNEREQEPVLEHLSFELSAGDCLLLVGASGSGKSTLLSLASGLFEPSAGKVLLKGSPPLPGQIGLVFQHPESQLFAQTVSEDILFGPKNLGLLKDDGGAALVDEVLLAVGLDPERFKGRSPYSLSGGEARRAAIASTLALQTEYLLLDEPTAGLDARGKVFIYELIQQLLAKNKGIIIATHDPDFFADLASSRMEL